MSERVEDKALSDLLAMTRGIDDQKLLVEITLAEESELTGKLLLKKQKIGEVIMKVNSIATNLG